MAPKHVPVVLLILAVSLSCAAPPPTVADDGLMGMVKQSSVEAGVPEAGAGEAKEPTDERPPGRVASTVQGSKGAFQVVLEPGVKETIDRIHAIRREFYSQAGNGPGYMEETQARMRRGGSDASVFVKINERGMLIGAFKRTGNAYQPYQIWAYDLNDDGKTASVRVTAGESAGKPALFLKSVDKSGGDVGDLVVTPFDSYKKGEGPGTHPDRLRIVYENDAEKAVEKIHAIRREFYAQGGAGDGRMDELQSELERGGQDASVYVKIDEKGKLVGAIKRTGNEHQPYQIWMYDLNDDGKTGLVRVFGHADEKDPALMIGIFGLDGEELGSVTIRALDSHHEKRK